MISVLDDFEHLYSAGRYSEAITVLQDHTGTDARQYAVLGISLLRLGNASDAEAPIQMAMDLGDHEASVEYGNLLRATGRFQEAEQHLNDLLPHLTEPFATSAQRWLGVLQHQRGDHRGAVKSLERVLREYNRNADVLNAAKVKQNLSVIYTALGDNRKALRILEDAVVVFRNLASSNLLIIALRNSIDLLNAANQPEQIPARLLELESLLGEDISVQHLHLWISKIALYEKTLIDENELVRLLDLVIEHSEGYGYHENLVWGIVRKIEYHLARDNTSEAMRLVYRAPQDHLGLLPNPVRTVRAMINRRLGNLREAIAELRAVELDLNAAGNVAELARVRLHLAFALYLDNQLEATGDVLRSALQGLLRTNIQPSMRPELEELSELLHFAALEPSLAPYLEPVMDSLAGVLGGSGAVEGERVRLQVHTLGRVSVVKGGKPVTFQLKGTVPLLVYLALTPNRTINEVVADLYPEKEPGTGSAYVRNLISELRKGLGDGAVLTEGPPRQSRYRLGPVLSISLDLNRFLDAVNRGEVARALALYRGEFLPGSDESEWVLQKRDEARLALTFELHNQMVAFRERHEWRRVILLANQYLRVNQHELSVHELRVEAARRVGTAAELGRYVAAMNSSVN